MERNEIGARSFDTDRPRNADNFREIIRGSIASRPSFNINSCFLGNALRFIQPVQYENATEPHSLGNKASPVQSVSGVRVEIYTVHPLPPPRPSLLLRSVPLPASFSRFFPRRGEQGYVAVINRVRVGIPSTQRATCCSVPTYTREKNRFKRPSLLFPPFGFIPTSLPTTLRLSPSLSHYFLF